MNISDIEARAFLREFQEQPEDIRRISIYVLCQTMVQAGLLELRGAFPKSGNAVTLIYRNPETGEVFEIAKPEISRDEEQAIGIRINELLLQNARAT